MKKINKRFKRNYVIIVMTILFSFMLAACQPNTQQEADETGLTVTVSILPQAYFVERIAGDAVTINVMVGPGEEAHTYEPTSEQMKSLNQSPVFFSIGVEYENSWIPRFKDINPELQVVDSTAGITRIEVPEGHTHDEEQEDDHAAEDDDHSEGLDPHVWLAPDNGKIIAENILDALIELLPEQSDAFQANYDALVSDITALDAEIEETLSGLDQRRFMVFHPAWGYFANQYNLEQIAVQVGGQDPSVREMAELVDISREENIEVIFIQPTFNAANAETLAEEINAEVAVVDPLASDWLSNLQKVAAAFAEALKD